MIYFLFWRSWCVCCVVLAVGILFDDWGYKVILGWVGREEEGYTLRESPLLKLKIKSSNNPPRKDRQKLCLWSRLIIRWKSARRITTTKEFSSKNRSLLRSKNTRPSKRNSGNIPVGPSLKILKNFHEPPSVMKLLNLILNKILL